MVFDIHNGDDEYYEPRRPEAGTQEMKSAAKVVDLGTESVCILEGMEDETDFATITNRSTLLAVLYTKHGYISTLLRTRAILASNLILFFACLSMSLLTHDYDTDSDGQFDDAVEDTSAPLTAPAQHALRDSANYIDDDIPESDADFEHLSAWDEGSGDEALEESFEELRVEDEDWEIAERGEN